MFTGIVEATGRLLALKTENDNLHLELEAPFLQELRVDQSLCHNGICLTVTRVEADRYGVTAIRETIQKTTLGHWKPGDRINLERCLAASGRFDGHIVQGHVDCTGICESVTEEGGSWRLVFSYLPGPGRITVEKGSVCVNGVSLTVAGSEENRFSVAIIPYTWENTQFSGIRAGDTVNLEFDILGKYMEKILRSRLNLP